MKNRIFILVLGALAICSLCSGLPQSKIISPSPILNRAQCQLFNQVLNQQWQELNRLYKKSDSRFIKFESDNSPYFVSGSGSDLVILLHGFLGSPFEMNRMATSLKNKGYSVLNDLIPGYGFSARVANQFNKNYWDNYFDTRYRAAFQCFKRVHMIGFSTGGQTIHKFLITHPRLKATSVHLISPFYAPTLKFLSLITDFIGLFKTEVPLSLLYVSTLGVKELKIMMTYPDKYLKEAPFLNMDEIVKSGKDIIDFKSTGKNSSPIILYVTNKDLVMDFEITSKLVSRDFSNIKSIDYSNTEAPHHLFRPEVSEVALKFEKTLLSFF